jgi:WD40 repeat protein
MRACRFFLPFLVLLATHFGFAGQNCDLPPTPFSSKPNIFTPEQEIDLGDAMTQHYLREFNLIEDPEVTGRLAQIGDRLLKHLPPTKLRFRFYLADLPETNAFSWPGGHIFVTRKLIAFVKSEDELAGVIGHEMGHILTHQGGIDVTKTFKDDLKIDSVGNRKDIFDKYHRLIENEKHHYFNWDHEEDEQRSADKIGIYATGMAGYSTQAMIDFFDRLAETKGHAGGSWSTGTELRLRDLIRNAAKIPDACKDAQHVNPSQQQEFEEWRAAVIAYTGLGHKEALHGVVSRRELNPPLQSDIKFLRYSPNGQFLLAQNEAGIYVLLRNPAMVMFFINAPGANEAKFTPDSAYVVFDTHGLHVETWSIADFKRVKVQEIALTKSCFQSSVSVDGSVLACYDEAFDLSLIDVEKGEAFFKRPGFVAPSFFSYFYRRKFEPLTRESDFFKMVNMEYSPDGRYFIAAAKDSTEALAMDLKTRTLVNVPSLMRDEMATSFAFVGSDKVLSVGGQGVGQATVRQWPSGEVVSKLTMGQQYAHAVGHGDYALLSPIKDYPIGLFDIKQNKLLLGYKREALDVYDNEYVVEGLDGELAFFNIADTNSANPVRKIRLPLSPLTELKAHALSSDANLLAVSESSRGAVWKLDPMERIFHLRSFEGACFCNDNWFYADFPKYDKVEHVVAKVDLNRKVAASSTAAFDKDTRARQYGAVVLVTKSRSGGKNLDRDVTVTAQDVATGNVLWTRDYPREAPSIDVDHDRLMLSWSLAEGFAKEDIQSHAEWKKLADGSDLWIKVLDLKTGTEIASLWVDTHKGAFRAHRTFSAGDWFALNDNHNRVHVYDLKTGALRGKMFGRALALVPASEVLLVETDRGKMAQASLQSLDVSDVYSFKSPIAMVEPEADGKHALVLTRDQTLFRFDLTQRQ